MLMEVVFQKPLTPRTMKALASSGIGTTVAVHFFPSISVVASAGSSFGGEGGDGVEWVGVGLGEPPGLEGCAAGLCGVVFDAEFLEVVAGLGSAVDVFALAAAPEAVDDASCAVDAG